jgi:hypothetical protein
MPFYFLKVFNNWLSLKTAENFYCTQKICTLLMLTPEPAVAIAINTNIHIIHLCGLKKEVFPVFYAGWIG